MTATQSRRMVVTQPLSLPSRSSSPFAKSGSLSSARSALADSTNVIPRSDACSPRYKGFVYPTSSTRTSCGWNDAEASTGSTPSPSPSHSRHHYLCSTASPFTVTSKAPPTVSISLSAVCSQSAPGQRSCGPGVQGMGPDLPDVRSAVPFPSTTLDGDADVEMLDGTCAPCPNGHLSSAGQAPRKRRSAHSSVSSSQGCFGKEANQKRPRKSKRQVAELWWLGVVHRSILRSVEARQSAESLDSMHAVLSRRDFDAMDRVLVEKIQKRLTENGCIEGRLPTCLLPRVSSPSISVPSLNLLATSRKTLPTDSALLPSSSELSSKGNATSSSTATPSPAFKVSPSTSSSTTSPSPIPSTTSMSHRRHVRFEIAQRPRPLQSHLSVPRRSPSPPARTGTIPGNEQTLTLTMPQLVASLTLAYNERNRLRMRGRTCKPADYGKNAGRFPSSAPCQDVRCGDGDGTQEKERIYQLSVLRARLSSAPEKKSPLSRVAYVDG